MQKISTALKVFLVYAILLGLLYPLCIVFTGKTLFPYQTYGSLLIKNGEVIGSELIAQEFTSPKYFHSRFSYIDYNAYNPTTSGASNLAPSNKILIENTKLHINQVKLENNLLQTHILPGDMVLNSASGLDPNITKKNAYKQIMRIATHRNISEETIKKLIKKNTALDFVGIWGRPSINVLKLNLALDDLNQ